MIDDDLIDNETSIFWEVSNSAFTVTFDSGFMIFDLHTAGYRYELGVQTSGDYFVASRGAKQGDDYTSSFGFKFDGGGTVFTVLEVANNGEFAVINFNDDEYDVLLGWTEYPQPSPTSFVDFEARCERGLLSVTVNGISADDIPGSLCNNAAVGLFGYAFDGTDTIRFDYFRYAEVK